MKNNELRIGNLVTVDNPKYHPKLKNIPLKIVGMSQRRGLENEITYVVDLVSLNELENIVIPLYSQFIKFIKPITLTEDIILNSGFVKDDNIYKNENMPHYYIEYLFSIYALRYRYWHNASESYMIKQLQYLHQFQNIFFDLTEKELDVNT
ncbi:hypothetical protein D0T53_11140 [Dysgonomonas sp. 216]|nr:hypothetical protein [Dysgonomonas sp. 216]